MKITVFGAGGLVGGRTVAEALARGHEVTAVVRDAARFAALDPAARPARGDATDPAGVARLAVGADLVVGATRPAPGREDALVEAARGLVRGTEAAGVRLLLVGGAGTLRVPGGGGTTVAEAPDFPPSWRPIAAACARQLAVCRAHPGTHWTYLSPPALLEPGARTGRYRVGGEELVVDADGRSAISAEDLAVALLDEAERPRHRGRRFTVGY
ncbi:NAD(P)-dependent oxidoreductase [Streptomyces sp. NPDC007088]|uniref:NAD(P)-dependent oxidoreductase n=1 Tax=Streptomyces sp. NPDC007088 TaxID=3364773 RepID=UPI0036C2EDF1